MKIKLILLLILLAVTMYGQEQTLKVSKNATLAEDHDVGDITNLTFLDYDDGDYELQIRKMDGSFIYYDLSTVSDLTFSELYNTPAAPSGLTITPDSISVVIDWEPVAGAVMYNVYRSETDPYSGFTILVYTPSVSFTDNSALIGNKYFYKVTARSNAK